MRVLASLVVICGWSAAARADPTAALPRKMKLAIEDYHLYVERGALKAPLPTRMQQIATNVHDVVVDNAFRAAR